MTEQELVYKAESILTQSEKQEGETAPRAKLVSDILWQVNHHRKKLTEYVGQLEYLVK
tara:strand:+ start:4729 stop:4902 length:174 start_codon:yes stop_codon:yes gene_type:complete